MALPDPSWRRKTRPCPFYQQGRCLFSDSCNFLHNVKAKTSSDALATAYNHYEPSHSSIDEPNAHATGSSVLIPPLVTVDSPDSISSPTRSPRLSGLLLALKDVIGDELQVVHGSHETSGALDQSNSLFESSALFNDSSIYVDGFSSLLAQYRNGMDSGNVSDEDDITSDSPVLANASFLSGGDEPTARDRIRRSQGSITSAIPFPSPPDEDEIKASDAADSSTHTAVPFPSINETPAASNGFFNISPLDHRTSSDLLSPVDMSPGPLPLLPSFPDRCEPSLHREDSIDSGYADSWTGPSPFLMSPPRSPRPPSTLDLLASPFGSPSARVLSPRLGSFIIRNPPGFTPTEDRFLSSNADYPSSVPFERSHILDDVDSVLDDIEELRLSDDSDEQEDYTGYVGEEEDATVTGCSTSDSLPPIGLDSEPPNDDRHDRTSISPSTHEQIPLPRSLVSLEPNNSYEIVHASLAKRETVFFEPSNTAVTGYDYSPTWMSSTSPIPGSPLDIDSTTEYRAPFLASADPTLRQEDFPGFSTSEADADALDSLYSSYSRSVSPEDLSDAAEQAQLLPSRHEITRSEDSPVHPRDHPMEDMFSRLYSPLHSRRGSLQQREFSSPSRPHTPQADLLSAAQVGLDLTPTTSSVLGGRVFTPPPLGRGRAGTIIATPTDVACSSSSPQPVLGSPYHGRSPESVKGKEVAIPEARNQGAEFSTKVPFGFRRSYTLNQASRSSSPSNRESQSISQRSRSNIAVDISPEHISDSETSLHSQPYISPTISNAIPSGLRPLRLSTVLNSTSSAPASASISASLLPSHPSSINGQSDSMKRISITSSASVSSGYSLSNNRLLSSARSSLIPEYIRNYSNQGHSQSAPTLHSQTWRNSSHLRHLSHADRLPRRASSRLSEPAICYGEDSDDVGETDVYDDTIGRLVPLTAPVTRPSSALQSPFHAIATPRPTLMFAIASDDAEQVRRVLESGEASPNDQVGPQSALAFALTNDQLTHKMEIVKALLAYGADPSGLRDPASNPPRSGSSLGDYPPDAATPTLPPSSILKDMDPATQYYIARADAPHTRQTSALIHRSFFRPLTRIRYDLIGQDCAIEQLFRVLSMHSQQLSVAPIVVLLCGPSGHGKSLLARKFGTLLDVPTHTVNMTTLQSTHDLWKSYSMSPYEEPSTSTLAEFLTANEGKRCVVVLDEIEKTSDEKALWSLLMPWELGRCSLEAGSRHIDVRNTIWLGTSNIGHNLVFDHHSTRRNPDELITREEYVELMGLLRPRVSDCLGASLLSRVTTVLPFVPFSSDEKMAIAAEAMYSLSGEMIRTLQPQVVQSMIEKSLTKYLPAEGARSLYRAVSNELVDVIP